MSTQLSDKDPDGTVLGQTGDKIGFYGVTAVSRTTLATLATAATIGTIRTSLQAVIARLKALGLAV